MSKMIVAVDFGTSFSGFAFTTSTASMTERPQCWMTYPDSGQSSVKAPTVILYNNVRPVAQPLAWGFSAQHRLSVAEDDRSLLLIKHVKRALNGEEMQQTPHGKRPADIAADFMRLFTDYIIVVLQQVRPGVRKTDIKWCLTVPALSRPSVKNAMITIAWQAGMIAQNNPTSEQLVLVTEPEAAAVYCTFDRAYTSGASGNGSAAASGQVGENILIVDLGGGTADLTVHSVTNAGLRELVKCEGDWCGGSYFDDNIFDFLKERVTPQVWNDWVTNDKMSWLAFEQQWEAKKCSHNGSDSIFVPIGSLLDYVKKYNELERFTRAQNSFRTQFVIIAAAEFDEQLQPILTKIFKTVDRILQDVRGLKQPYRAECDYMLLVGGFSQAPAIRRAITDRYGDRFGNRERIISPNYAQAAVVTGAAIYCRDPSRVLTRVMRVSYGIQSYKKLLPGETADGSERMIGGPAMYRKFSKFATVGEQFESDHVATQTFYPADASATSVLIKVFYSNLENPGLISDTANVFPSQACELRLGEVGRSTEANGSRPIIVSFQFGTVLKVSARDAKLDKTIEVDVVYLESTENKRPTAFAASAPPPPIKPTQNPPPYDPRREIGPAAAGAWNPLPPNPQPVVNPPPPNPPAPSQDDCMCAIL